MTNKQENRFKMYLATKDYAVQLSAIANTIPGFSGYFTQFQGYMTQIQTLRDIQEGDKTGITLNKTQLKEALVALAADTSSKLVAYASSTNNPALEREVTFSDTDLRRVSEITLRDRAQLLYNRANANLGAVASYGITAVSLAGLLTAINNYISAIPKPRLTRNDKKTATQNINRNFELANEMLVKMDKMVAAVRTTQPAFYAAYMKARRIVELGGTSLALIGSVNDADGLKLGKVTVEILPAGNPLAKAVAATSKGAKLLKKSTTKGGFQLKNLADGTYVATASKSGFRTQAVPFSITQGELTRLQLVMERE